MGAPPTILVVDDEAAVLHYVQVALESDGMRVHTVRSGEDALAALGNASVDLVVLDVMMPGMDGLEALRRIRATSTVPVIMLTGRTRALDKLNALTNGADDYLTKPFNPDELAARIMAILRRTRDQRAGGQGDLRYGDVVINLKQRRVTRGGAEMHFSRTEWELLAALATNPGTLLTGHRLLARVWGAEYGGEAQYLHTWMSRLRKKLGGAVRITTFPGVGYRLEPPAQETDPPAPPPTIQYTSS